MPENKVVYGVKNAHYAVITEGVDGTFTYATPVPMKGSVEITLEPKGEQADFYADNVLYYTTTSNQGYETTLTIANITELFRTDVLGETMSTPDNILTENTNAKPKKIAFLFEFDGDQKAVRHTLYNCTVSRPSITSSTKTETTEPTPKELKLVAAPRPQDGIVKRSTTATTTSLIYDGWYGNVYEPSTTVPPTAITVTPDPVSIVGTATQQLSVAYTPSTGVTTGVTYASANVAIATVDSSGLVTGVAAGSTTITVTSIANSAITDVVTVTIT